MYIEYLQCGQNLVIYYNIRKSAPGNKLATYLLLSLKFEHQKGLLGASECIETKVK